ncbi:MAG: TetR/AcrR family transcriptional regulator [Desulfobacterales bacterium]|nr:TetR/AcrR family transcriptional regulator [Desulfobacterales bacterium]
MKKKNKNAKHTQASILDAAIQVFAQKSYNAASIRMIANQGGFAHALVRYYYPTKAELFDAAAQKICTELCQAAEKAVLEVRRMERAPGFNVYVSRLIEFSRQHPWSFRIILLNLCAETVETVPGRTRFINAVESIREQLIHLLKFNASHDEVCRFSDSFNALLFYYLGTPESAAWLLHLDPDSDEYFKWVQQTLVDIFLPALEGLF